MFIDYNLKLGDFKRVSIRIDCRGTVRVSAPRGYSRELIENIILSKKIWIDKILEKLRKRAENRVILKENEILYLGRPYGFEKVPALGRNTVMDEKKGVIKSGADLIGNKTSLRKFYRERAAFLLPAKTSAAAREHGFAFTKVSVRNMKRRWGSCSSKGSIVLNEKLILAPLFAIEAIVFHELTHTKIMNHSKDFYKALEYVCPLWREAEAWLREKMPPDYPPETDKNLSILS